MKTCVSIPGGAIRSIICVPEIIEYISCELGYSPFDATDQSIGTSAGTITITQNALKAAAKKRTQMSIKAFNDQVDQQNKENVTKIFKSKTKAQMLGIDTKFTRKNPIQFKAPQDNSILPSVINEAFDNPVMSDFAMRTAFTVYVPQEDGKYGIKLVTSYDMPDAPVADIVGASCSFPLAFGAYDLKTQWLNQKPNKTIKAFDGGLGCPNPSWRGLEEVEEIAEIDEEIAVFSMMMIDKKAIDYTKLYQGGTMRWLDPLRGSPLTQISFNALYSEPHRQLTRKAQSKHSKGLFKYYPIHLEITDEDRKKYKVNFDSTNSSSDNLYAFQELTYSRVRTDEFRKNLEPVLQAFDKRMTEKRKEYRDTVIPITAIKREAPVQISAITSHNNATGTVGGARPNFI